MLIISHINNNVKKEVKNRILWQTNTDRQKIAVSIETAYIKVKLWKKLNNCQKYS